MSGSDRGKRSKSELVAFAAISLVFIVGTLTWAVPEHLSFSGQATDNSEHHESRATDQIGRNCVRLPSTTFDDCVEEARATSEERQREERDLEAQRKMALWTAIMGAMATIGVGLSGFGVYLIWRTWDATREAADSSAKTLRAFIAKERGFLVPQGAKKALNVESSAEGFLVKLFNAGAAPATILETEWSFITDRQWPESFTHREEVKRTIVAEADGRTPFLGGALMDPSVNEWLVGVVTYTTLETERFQTPFSYALGFNKQDGYAPAHWFAHEAFMPGMPHHT